MLLLKDYCKYFQQSMVGMFEVGNEDSSSEKPHDVTFFSRTSKSHMGAPDKDSTCFFFQLP